MSPPKCEARDPPIYRYAAAYVTLAAGALLLLRSQWGHVRDVAPRTAAADEKGLGVSQPPADLRFARRLAGGRLYCGDWQAEYRDLHAAMLRGERPPRYMVAQGISGLADNLVGAITLFYVALLSDRAFFLHMVGGRQYKWAYQQPNIDWTWDGSRAIDNSTWHLTLEPYPSTKDNAEPQHIRQGNLREFGQEYAVISAKTYLGLTVELFDNKFHRAQLFRMGLRPETALACAMDFLFEPREELKQARAAEVAALQDPATLKIGIQIRTGDSVLMDHAGGRIRDFDSYRAFFECAQAVEDGRRLSLGQPVVWYLVSDSLALRKAAAVAFGPKLLTDVTVPLGHMSQDEAVQDVEGVFHSAALEQWLFSMADAFVISRNSGFGRIAAFWSGQWHSVYSVLQNHRDPAQPPAEPRACGARDYDSLEQLSIKHVGWPVNY